MLKQFHTNKTQINGNTQFVKQIHTNKAPTNEGKHPSELSFVCFTVDGQTYETIPFGGWGDSFWREAGTPAANLNTNIMDFRGFDSSVILILRGGIPRPIGNLPGSSSQAILVGIMLVGRLGVSPGNAAVLPTRGPSWRPFLFQGPRRGTPPPATIFNTA